MSRCEAVLSKIQTSEGEKCIQTRFVYLKQPFPFGKSCWWDILNKLCLVNLRERNISTFCACCYATSTRKSQGNHARNACSETHTFLSSIRLEYEWCIWNYFYWNISGRSYSPYDTDIICSVQDTTQLLWHSLETALYTPPLQQYCVQAVWCCVSCWLYVKTYK